MGAEPALQAFQVRGAVRSGCGRRRELDL